MFFILIQTTNNEQRTTNQWTTRQKYIGSNPRLG